MVDASGFNVPAETNQDSGEPVKFDLVGDRPKTFEDIRPAIIDPKGIFKYIQIIVKNTKTQETKTIVRGYASCAFHADILSLFQLQELIECKDRNDLNCDCPGGGRIVYESDEGAAEKVIKIYGFSQGFGRANHAVTEQIIKQQYPDMKTSWTNDGY